MLYVIASFYRCVDGSIAMNLWQEEEGKVADQYKNNPMWYAQSKGGFFKGKITKLGFYGLREVA